jgi:hypothetical protein
LDIKQALFLPDFSYFALLIFIFTNFGLFWFHLVLNQDPIQNFSSSTKQTVHQFAPVGTETKKGFASDGHNDNKNLIVGEKKLQKISNKNMSRRDLRINGGGGVNRFFRIKST